MKEKAAALADAGSTESAVEIAKAAADTAVGDGSSTQPVAQKKKAKTRKAKVRFCLSLFALASFCFYIKAGGYALHGAQHHRVPEEKRRHGPDHEMEVQQVRQDGATVRRCNWILVRPPQLLKLRGVGANIQI